MKKSFADILNDISSADLQKMARKVPEWASTEGLEFPTRLCMEQCSSSETARYKTALCERMGSHSCIVDLTGGLGVDSWAFSQIAEHIIYNEMNPVLFEAVKANFAKLGVTNAVFSNAELVPGGLEGILGGIAPDIIFIDPARRGAGGKKVFLIEDCTPDVLTLKEDLLAASPNLLIKLSPMADITMVCKRLGPEVREVHSVSAEGECKELLIWMQRGWNGGYTISAGSLTFSPEEEKESVPVFAQDPEALGAMGFLFEPSSTLMKTGAFNLLCSRYGLVKAGHHSHLYMADEITPSLFSLGKWFGIRGMVPFDKRNISELGKQHPRCEVTARNIPMTSEELKKKMGAASGSDTHIFAFGADFQNAKSSRWIMVTERLYF